VNPHNIFRRFNVTAIAVISAFLAIVLTYVMHVSGLDLGRIEEEFK